MNRMFKLVCVGMIVGAHIGASTQALAAAYPTATGIVHTTPPLEWLPGGYAAVEDSPEQAVSELLAPAMPKANDEDKFGERDHDVERLSELLEEIAELTRRVRPEGADPVAASAVAGRTGDADPLALARAIVELAASAGNNFEVELEADWEDEGQDMARAGVSATVAQRRGELMREFRHQANEFRRLTRELEQAVRGTDRGAVAAALVALTDWIATQQTARGYRAIDKDKLPFRLAKAGQVPEPGKSLPDSGKSAKNLASPTDADLAETDEVKLTPEIRALAQELGNNPVAIRNWVYNHIEFSPTHGSIQGAALTLLNRSGNAMDIASLTIALLRAAGVPARYVYGVVDLPEAKVRNWLGDLSTAAMAVDLMQKGQIPTAGVAAGGSIRTIRFEHVWVEAYVDFVPSRGAKNLVPDQWVPIDASFKQFEYADTIPVRERMQPAFAEAADEFARGATIGADGGVTGLDFDALDARLQAIARQEAARTLADDPGATPDQFQPRRSIVPIEQLMLEGALPYNTQTATPARFSVVPDRYRHVLRVQLFADETSLRYDSPTRMAEIPLVRIGTQRLFVDNVPASDADAQALAQYAAANAETMPIGQINVVPELRLGDTRVLQAPGVRMGTQLIWTTDLRGSHGSTTSTEPMRFAAGSHIVFLVNHGGISAERAEREGEPFEDRATLPIKDVLYFGGLTYWMLHDRYDVEGALAVGGRALRLPSVGSFSAPLQARYFFGVPRTGYFKGYTSDVKIVSTAVAAPTSKLEVDAGLHMGGGGSLFESIAWNLVTGSPITNPGISAASLIKTAIDQGQPIYQITAQNAGTALAALQLSADAENEIRNAVDAGLVVVAHRNEIQNRGWSGAGYVIFDPASGASIQRVEGGLAGGLNYGCLSQAVLLAALCKLKIIKAAKRLLFRLVAGAAAQVAAWAAMTLLLGPAGAVIGAILTIVRVAICYAMAVYEVYTWVNMIMNGVEALTQEDLDELGIDDLNAVICSYAPSCLGGFGGLGSGAGGGGGDGDGAGNGAGGPLAGNPTAIGTGAKWQVEVDYEGQGSFPLRWQRTYSSAVPKAGSIVGAKWTASYFARIHLPQSADGTPFPVDRRPDQVLLARPDGGWFQFNWRSDRYVGDSNIPGSLTRLVSGTATAGFEYRNHADELERYDAHGRLVSVTARGGLTHTLEYDPQRRLARIVDSFGRALSLAYDAESGLLASVTDPANGVIRYRHDEAGNLVEVTYPDGRRREYHYESLTHRYHLTGITDERGIRTSSWTYDVNGRVKVAARAGDVDRHELRYGNLSTTVIDPLGTERTYEYALRYDRPYLARTTQPCSACGSGGSAATTYDGSGYVASQRDFRGNTTTYGRDARGLVTSLTEAVGTPVARTTTMIWHPVYRTPTRITEPVAGGTRVTDFTHDARGNVLTRRITVGAQSRTWTYTYQPGTDLVLTEDGPRTDVNDITTYTYDAQGNRATKTDAAGHVTRYPEYNAHGQVVRMIDPNGLETQYTYDVRQRLTRTAQGAEITQYAYDASGNLQKITLPDGSLVAYGYDGAGRLTSIEDALGNRVVFTLNANGDRVAEKTFDARGELAVTLTRAIDALGRIESETGSTPEQVTRFVYDENGNEKTLTDPLEQATTSSYDALDRLASVTDPAQGVITYGYDPRDNLASVTDPRNVVTRYGYSGFDELTRLESPDTGVTQYQYDAAGNLSSSTDARGVTATYRYDALDRVTQIDYPAVTGLPAERLAFVYDEAAGGAGAKGRLTHASDRSGTTAYTYDAEGRVTRKVQTLGTDTASAKTVTYAYDDAKDRLVDLTLPSGAAVRYGYGADGRVVTLEVNGVAVVREIEYFPYGEPESWRYGTNGRYERIFDRDGRIARHTAGREARTIGYDAASRITSIADAGTDRPRWTYGYDALDRLIEANNESTTGVLAAIALDWTYDPTGNRTQQTLTRDGATTATPYAIAPTSNRLTSVAGTARSYDAVGNTVGDGTRTSLYSGRNRLVEVRQGAAIVARYTHNAFGERVCKALDGASCPTRSADGTGTAGSGSLRQFVYDQDGHLLGEYDASGALIAEHVWLGDTPVATLRPAASGATHGGTVAGNVAVYFVHPDHLDTPRAIVNANDQHVWRWDSTPFGDTAAQENPEGLGAFAHELRFPGQYADGESATYYNYFRDYEAATGRYAQSDPSGLSGGPNTFSYGNALAESDPLGLIRLRCIWPFCKPKPSPNPRVSPRSSPPPQSGMGIYMLVDTCTGEVVYVGQTNSFRRRWSEHRTRDDGKIRNLSTSCCPVVMVPIVKMTTYNPALFAALEARYIRKYRPTGNLIGAPVRKNCKDC